MRPTVPGRRSPTQPDDHARLLALDQREPACVSDRMFLRALLTAILLAASVVPAAADCPSTGDVLFDIDDGIAPGAPAGELSTTHLQVFDGGAWTFVERRTEAIVRTANGCLADAELAQLRKE